LPCSAELVRLPYRIEARTAEQARLYKKLGRHPGIFSTATLVKPGPNASTTNSWVPAFVGMTTFYSGCSDTVVFLLVLKA
jgi:hypothetical protein